MLKKEFQERIRYVMNYSLDKTSKENLLEENTPSPTGVPLVQYIQLPDALKITPKLGGTTTEWYEWGCKYPKMAVPPPKIPGHEELDDEDYKISGFCAYRVTKDEANYFPSETEIIFSDNESVNINWEKAKKVWKKYFYNAPKETIEVLEKQYKDKFNEGSVVAFTPPGGEQFVRTISLKNFKNLINAEFTLRKYCTRGTDGPSNNCYNFEVWVDRRKSWQIFLDKWELTFNIVAMTIAALATIIVPEIAFPIEAIMFTVLGGTYGYRAWTKGDNIGVGVNVFFALLPYLRLFKGYQGISKEVWKSLSIKVSKYDLVKNPWDYFKLVEECTESEKLALNIISRQDPTVLAKSLEKIMTNNQESLTILKEILEDKKIAPKELLRAIPFWERLWVKDLKLIGIMEILKLSLNLCCKKALTDEKKAKEVFIQLPKEVQEYLSYQLVNNPNTIKSTIDEMDKQLKNEKRKNKNYEYAKELLYQIVDDSLNKTNSTIYDYQKK